ncbi:hypothetical protein Pcinc_020129 [Petrolisthes cinctipes]|uniref:3-hydroxyisobutyrate dehydrogenase n=1 Tax=Petrolisthes cinctipes TaxID=88211 RepID=A0AAE1FIV0_PETCI|nr:hypothetical protein Pcinc_020129 [Petrolisthes cinctipes]
MYVYRGCVRVMCSGAAFNRVLLYRHTSPLSKQYTASLTTANTHTTTVGVVGCGNVGKAVVHNLVRAGYKVVAAYDLDSTRFKDLPSCIEPVASPRQVAEKVDVVITGLPRPANVKAAVEGSHGLMAGLTKDKVWIDHSTTDPNQTKVYSEEAEGKGAHVLEAPITGGMTSLKKGQMVVHIGGQPQVAEAMTPLLKASYKEVFYVGEIGMAMLVKVVSNMLACVNVVAMGEVLMLAKRAGLDLNTFWRAIRVSAGNSFVWETGAPLVFNGQYDPGFPLTLQNKDLQLGYDMAIKYQVPIDLHQAVMAIYRRSQYQLGDEAGCYSPPKTYELALGESINIPGFEEWSYDNEIINGSLVVKHSGLDE